MATELKTTTVETVHEELLNQVSDSYQKTEGFPVWDILKAMAFGIKRLWDKCFKIEYLQDVDNLTGADLERFIYQRKGLTRKAATYATGYIQIVSGSGDIDAGDLFATETNIQFESLETKHVNQGDTVAIRAVKSGSEGNVIAGIITQMPVTIQGISQVTNPDVTSDGYDEETDESLRERYYEALQEPATSGNVYHYRRWAKEVPGIGDCKVFPLWDGDNTVQVVVVDDDGLVPSPETVARCQEYIDPNSAGTGLGEAPIGAYCTVVAADPLTVNISVTVQLDNTRTVADIKTEFEGLVTKFFASIVFNSQYISPAKVGNLLLNCEGVSDYDSLLLNNSASRITIPDKSIPVLGTVTINVQ